MTSKRSRARTTWMVALAFLVVLAQAAAGIIITPPSVALEEYWSDQEVVVTFHNDGYEPLGCRPAATPESAYLERYVTLEPSKFLLPQGEEVNVKVITSFPKDLPPQRHELILQAYPGSEERFTISFRPPGEQLVSLAIQEFRTEEESSGRAVTASMSLKNTGNTYLFVTPQVFIKRDGRPVKNMTYPRPLVVAPQESYPLTLRQDNADLEPGDYEGEVQVLYRADGPTLITDEESFSFSVIEEERQLEERPLVPAPLMAGLAGLIGIGGLVLLWRRKPAHKRRKREKHITRPTADVVAAWRDVHGLRKELASLSQETHSFAREAERWLREHR